MFGEFVILLFCLGSISTNKIDKLENFIKNDADLSFDEFVSQISPHELKNIRLHFQDHEDQFKKNNQVGFGGPPHPSEKRMLFRNVTDYVNKVINHAQKQLEQNAHRIWANNPPQVIDKIPHTPIIFTLKYIEGASSMSTNGTSWGIHYYDEVYVSARYRFDEIKYFYDVQIRPFNLFGIHKSLTVVLADAPAAMNFSFEKNYGKIPRFEFIKPEVGVDIGIHRWINYALNYAIDEKYPKFKKKLVKIVSADTLLLLQEELKNSQ